MCVPKKSMVIHLRFIEVLKPTKIYLMEALEENSVDGQSQSIQQLLRYFSQEQSGAPSTIRTILPSSDSYCKYC